MQRVEPRLRQAGESGYQVLDSFVLPVADWDAFSGDVAQSLARAGKARGESQAFQDLAADLAIFARYRGLFGYAFFILQKVGNP